MKIGIYQNKAPYGEIVTIHDGDNKRIVPRIGETIIIQRGTFLVKNVVINLEQLSYANDVSLFVEVI